MKQLLCISGKRGSGKTMLAKALEKYGYTRLSLAKNLKDKCKWEFGLTDDQVNGCMKESPTQYGNYLTPREIMIKMGAFYRSIDPDYWLKALYPSIEAVDKVVIDDVRFLNEIKYLKENYNAKLVRLERDSKLNIFKEELRDVSETELDTYVNWDYLLVKELNRNPDDLEKLAQYIEETI